MAFEFEQRRVLPALVRRRGLPGTVRRDIAVAVDGVAAEAVVDAAFEVAEEIAITHRVIGARIGDAVVECRETLRARSERIDERDAEEAHRVLASERQAAIFSVDTDVGLSAEEAAALSRCAG